MTRININMLMIVLSLTAKDIFQSLKNIFLDINNDTEALNQVLKWYLI